MSTHIWFLPAVYVGMYMISHIQIMCVCGECINTGLDYWNDGLQLDFYFWFFDYLCIFTLAIINKPIMHNSALRLV